MNNDKPQKFCLWLLLLFSSASHIFAAGGDSLCFAVMQSGINFTYDAPDRSTNHEIGERRVLDRSSSRKDSLVHQGIFLGTDSEGAKVHIVGVGETKVGVGHFKDEGKFNFNISDTDLVQSFFENSCVYWGTVRVPVKLKLKDGSIHHGLAAMSEVSSSIIMASYDGVRLFTLNPHKLR